MTQAKWACSAPDGPGRGIFRTSCSPCKITLTSYFRETRSTHWTQETAQTARKEVDQEWAGEISAPYEIDAPINRAPLQDIPKLTDLWDWSFPAWLKKNNLLVHS